MGVKERLQIFKLRRDADSCREDMLIEELLTDADNAHNRADHYYDRMNQETQQRRDMETQMSEGRFIAVLIDGNSLLFQDCFVVNGYEGGISAGEQLISLAKAIHQDQNPLHRAEDKVVLYISADLKVLNEAYEFVPDVIADFVDGLIHSDSLCTFVNATSQDKLDAHLRLWLSNTHCQGIIWGGHRDDVPEIRVTLLKPGPFRYARMSQTEMSSNIFREATTGIKRDRQDSEEYSSHEGTVGIKRERHESEEYTVQEASVVKRPKEDSELSYNPREPAMIDDARPPRTSFVNQHDQRLDVPVRYDKQFLRKLFAERPKLCNNHYLRGHCAYGDSCRWDHSMDLSPLQINSLRHKARTSACCDPYCHDPECTLGHVCPRPRGQCRVSDCKFSPEQHDLKIDEVFEIDPVAGTRIKCSRAVFYQQSGEKERTTATMTNESDVSDPQPSDNESRRYSSDNSASLPDDFMKNLAASVWGKPRGDRKVASDYFN